MEPALAPAREAEGIEPDRPRPRRWWVVGITAVAVAGAVWWLLAQNGSGATEGDEAAPLRTSQVVRTDLTQTESLDGTLGRVAGDPITAGSQGTVTASTAAGTTADRGDVLVAVDGEPTVLLLGEAAAFRDLAPSEDIVAVNSRSHGTVTWVAEWGSPVEQGDVLYEVNGEPVFALYGDTPAYRSMQDIPRGDNMTGDDIFQLEQALTELGYNANTVTVDGEFTANTAAMVEAWQEDVGANPDGVVHLGEVVFIPGPGVVVDTAVAVGDTVNDSRPVASVTGVTSTTGDDVLTLEENLAALGFDAGGALTVDGTWDDATTTAVMAWQTAVGAVADGVVGLGEIWISPSPLRITDQIAGVGSTVNPGAPVLAVSSSDTVVTLDLPAEDQGALEVGNAVTVILPDRSETPATVTEVATIATVSQQGRASFTVTISLDDPEAANGLDEAPVDVEYVTDTAFGVLAVPVTSLVALAEGGYAVEVEQVDGSTRLVAVDPGFFADGLVEIDAQLAVGDRVVVP
jgi:peptidoglycan hydrolase-like protein with peptidoglycan-binding domain